MYEPPNEGTKYFSLPQCECLLVAHYDLFCNFTGLMWFSGMKLVSEEVKNIIKSQGSTRGKKVAAYTADLTQYTHYTPSVSCTIWGNDLLGGSLPSDCFTIFIFVSKGVNALENIKTEDMRQCTLCQNCGDSAPSVSLTSYLLKITLFELLILYKNSRILIFNQVEHTLLDWFA